MTNDELDAIEARANAATPGPWVTRKHAVEQDMVRQLHWVDCGERGHDDCAVAQTVALVRLGHTDDDAIPNADFIAHAREDIPRLLAEIRELRAALLGRLPSPPPY